MKNIINAHAKGVLYALTFTVVLVFVSALAVQYGGLSNALIGWITQAIKALSIFIGVVIVAKNVTKNAWAHGGVLGIVYTALVFLILSIIDGDFSITDGFLYECIFAGVIGIFCAMLVRLRKKI